EVGLGQLVDGAGVLAGVRASAGGAAAPSLRVPARFGGWALTQTARDARACQRSPSVFPGTGSGRGRPRLGDGADPRDHGRLARLLLARGTAPRLGALLEALQLGGQLLPGLGLLVQALVELLADFLEGRHHLREAGATRRDLGLPAPGPHLPGGPA